MTIAIENAISDKTGYATAKLERTTAAKLEEMPEDTEIGVVYSEGREDRHLPTGTRSTASSFLAFFSLAVRDLC